MAFVAEKIPQVDDDVLSELIVVVKKVAGALGIEHYNILQNNGKLAKQSIKHVHFHIIPKSETEGFDFIWVPKKDPKGLEEVAEGLRNKLTKKL